MLTIKQKDFNKLIGYLKNNYGIDLSKKRILVESRLGGFLTGRQSNDFENYLEELFNDNTGKEASQLLNRLTTNHTYFMREAAHFKYLVEHVFPWLEIAARDRDIRIWSAGCSTGEEAYTLAMLLNDYFKSSAYSWDKKVLATDISEKALDKASKGIYSYETVSRLPEVWKKTYFNKKPDDTFEVCREIKDEVIFAHFNLNEDELPFRKKFHVIFCRNVMIYFGQDTKANLINRFFNATEPGGYLFIGHSESIGSSGSGYKYVIPAAYRKG